MTSMLLRPSQPPGLEQTYTSFIAPALSDATKAVADRIQALHNAKSPGSKKPESTAARGSESIAEKLFDALASVKILTSQVAMHLDKTWRDRLFQQLDFLHDPDEWDVQDRPLQEESFSTFLKAILSIQPQRRPGLGLTYGGQLIAAWSNGDERLTIEFHSKDRVRWVLARVQDGDLERFAGETSVARMAASLAAYRPEKWFANDVQNQQPA